MKKFSVPVILILNLLITPAFGQRKILERFFSDENDTTRKGRFIILPALGYAQETGFEYGLVSLTSFYSNKDSITRNSSIPGLIAFTTKKQSMLTLKPDVWSKYNRYHYVGDLRYRNFPFKFYGVGANTFEADEQRITQKLTRVSIEAEKLMRRGSYTGITASYENHRFYSEEPGGIYETNSFIRDKDGGDVLFVGLSKIFDARNSNVYTTKGSYIKLNYAYAPDLFGGENFSGSSAKLDFRTFKGYNIKTVLGFNMAYHTIQGSSTPFYLLPQLGNDQIMRGYYTGRYRDRNLLAAQLELRYRVIPRLGFAGFAGAGSVYNSRIDLGNFKPTYGAGLRYFFDTIRGLSLRMDYAFGEKRTGEERQKGFYLAFGEAF